MNIELLQIIFAWIGLCAVIASLSAVLIFAIDAMVQRGRRKRNPLNRPRWIYRV